MRITEEEYSDLMRRTRPQVATVVPDTVPLESSEVVFQAKVIAYAQDLGWWVYHTHRSDRSEPGFPDLVLIHRTEPRIVYAELKRIGGQPTYAQWWVLMRLQELGHEAYLWRTDDWPEIVTVLDTRQTPEEEGER